MKHRDAWWIWHRTSMKQHVYMERTGSERSNLSPSSIRIRIASMAFSFVYIMSAKVGVQAYTTTTTRRRSLYVIQRSTWGRRKPYNYGKRRWHSTPRIIRNYRLPSLSSHSPFLSKCAIRRLIRIRSYFKIYKLIFPQAFHYT